MKGKSSSKSLEIVRKKRPGVHAKCKHSVSKNSKFYVKPNRGQG